MNLEEYKQRFADDSAPGWDALTDRLREIYGEQTPKHWGTVISYMLGGPDPLDGISAYECTDGGICHLHFTSFGYSSLYYDEEAPGAEFSRFGFEMTFRLASPLPPNEEPIWACDLLQNIAGYVFDSGKWFENYHWIPANGPIRADADTAIVGLGFVVDPVLGSIDTPHGQVDFLQAFGLTQSELDALTDKSRTCEDIIEQHRKSNPLLVTDLLRKDH